MASAAAAKRRGPARATKAEAKQRRQKIFVVVLAVVFALLLVYQVPRMLKTAGKSEAAPAAAAPIARTSAPPSADVAKRLTGSRTGADPFVARGMPNGDPAAASADRPDPFTGPSAATPATHTPVAAPLPKQIVIGSPGGNRVAEKGFIVILASIPTRNGRNDAVRFARQAGRNVGRLSILNSSHSRPLRGGYWVVYSGPYATLGAVSKRVGAIHAAGYRTAYLRELIAYK